MSDHRRIGLYDCLIKALKRKFCIKAESQRKVLLFSLVDSLIFLGYIMSIVHGKITRVLGQGLFVIQIKDLRFNPIVGMILSFLPSKDRVDRKRKQIFKFLEFLAQKADYRLLFGDDAVNFEGQYHKFLKRWRTNEVKDWFRSTLLLDAGISEPARVYYFTNEGRKYFDGIKPFSLSKENAGLKELITVYEELKRHVCEKGVSIDEWESQQGGE